MSNPANYHTCYFSAKLSDMSEAVDNAELRRRIAVLKADAMGMLPKKPPEEYRALVGKVDDEWRLYVTSNGLDPAMFWKQETGEIKGADNGNGTP